MLPSSMILILGLDGTLGNDKHGYIGLTLTQVCGQIEKYVIRSMATPANISRFKGQKKKRFFAELEFAHRSQMDPRKR